MKKNVMLFLFLMSSFSLLCQITNRVELKMMPAEYWWTGVTSIGHQMPYSDTSVTSVDMWFFKFG